MYFYWFFIAFFRFFFEIKMCPKVNFIGLSQDYFQLNLLLVVLMSSRPFQIHLFWTRIRRSWANRTHCTVFKAVSHGHYFACNCNFIYSPSCLDQETAKGPFGLRVKLPAAHLSTTHCGGFTLFLFIAERQAWKL